MCHYAGGWIVSIDALLIDVDKEENAGFCIPVRAFTMYYGLSYWGHVGFGPCTETAKQT
jgi:hypothetical protein